MANASKAAGRRRSPTKDELRAWRSFIETSWSVRAAIAALLHQESGLSAGDYAVLLALTEAPEHRMRSAALADQIDWERSRLSHHLGRMERRALITREQSSGDSRGAEIILSDTGSAVFRRAAATHLQAVQNIYVHALSADQLYAVEDAMHTLRAHLDSRAGSDRAIPHAPE
jgi:DNA-binding MarR family transcriptional regulator